MFAVMKHYDVMIGIDRHICWPPGSPKPIGLQEYLTIMLLHGIQPLTPMMAPTCLTLHGMAMQRGTDIGPGIPHIGPPSKLTPLDILFSSSASYFGPSTYHAEAMPVAAALAVVVNINVNCWSVGPIPSGIVICPTTHFTGMTPMDILFGFVSYGVDFAFEAATDKLADVLGPVIKKQVIGPISGKLTSKLASKTAAGAAGSASAKTASRTAGRATPQLGAHRPASAAGGAPAGPRPGSFTPGKAPGGPRPPGGPSLGSQRPQSPQPWRPGQTPGGARPPGGPSIGSQRPQPSRPWTPARPNKPNKPPAHVWTPGKPNPGQRPPGGPTLGGHRPDTGPSLWEIYRDFGYDALMELLLEVPMSIPQQYVYELLALSGIEEFGAPPEEQDG